MERKRRLPPSRERNVESFDEDASVIEFMSYRSAPPTSKGGVRPDDAMPLFLSDPEAEEEAPRRPRFGRIRDHEDDEPPRVLKSSIAPRIIKVGIFAISAAAIIASLLSVQNPPDLFSLAPPHPPAAPAPTAKRLAAADLANLLKRAKGLIAIGHFAPARLLRKRAAGAQEASAALLLAQPYDPAGVGKQDMRSITPDPA